MLLDEGRQRGIRREIGFVPQERRIEAEDASDRGRQAPKQFLELFTSLASVGVLVQDDGRRGLRLCSEGSAGTKEDLVLQIVSPSPEGAPPSSTVHYVCQRRPSMRVFSCHPVSARGGGTC